MKFVLVSRQRCPGGWWILRDDRDVARPGTLRPALLWREPTWNETGFILYRSARGAVERWASVVREMSAGDLFVLRARIEERFGAGLVVHPTKSLLIVKEDP